MVIKNFAQLATNQLRHHALEIIAQGIFEIQPEIALKQKIKLNDYLLSIDGTEYNLTQYKHLYIVGIGKASFQTAKYLDHLLGSQITAGVIIDIKVEPLNHIKTFQGTHPIPSETNIAATDEIIKILETAEEHDLVICIISGGGSVLLCSPHNLSCTTLQNITDQLLKSGADIQEMNTYRKHVSQIHGGNLAKFAYPATVVSLIFSDVPYDEASIVASGPTFLDTSTIDQAKAIAKKYHLDPVELTETPKESKYFEKVTNCLVLSNQTGLNAMAGKAKALGYDPIIYSHTFKSDTHTAGKKLLEHLLKPKSVILAGGETTVQITGHGMGGRNQEVALATLPYLKPNQLLLSVASDGKDNIQEAAGALVDQQTIQKMTDQHLNPQTYLTNNDSYHFFAQTGDLIITDLTGTNVSDFILAIQD